MSGSNARTTESESRRVLAIIVTHDDPDAVQSCVASVQAQTCSVSEVLIVDTHGARPVPLGVYQCGEGVVVDRLDHNVGPAGGWAHGLSAFVSSEHDAAWLLDDDCVAQASSLEHSLAGLEMADVVQARMVERFDGREADTQGWCGVLLKRSVVETVGVPDPDLVWWTEDTEYLQWRIPRAGFKVIRSNDAIVEVALRPDRAPKPAWKYYYEARNQVRYRTKTQRPTPDDQPVRRYLTRRVRWWRAARSVVKLAGRSVFVERSGRAVKLAMVVRGTYHGMRGVTGLTVPLGSPDRARTSVVGAAGSASGRSG